MEDDIAARMVREAKAKKLYLLTIISKEGAFYTMPPSDDYENLCGAQEHLIEAFPELGFEITEIKES